jgi:beta-N-acetylhexosaminidase
MRAVIVGISGPALLASEAAALRTDPPAGVILFARNVENPGQLAALVADLRSVLPGDAVLMVDQEGGRVARLRPPHWRAHPAAAAIGAVAARRGLAAGERAAFLSGALIGLQCRAAGFDVVCAPVLDLAVAGADAVVGDRAFSPDPALVAVVGGAMARGLLAAGIQPVAKHAPGHGRAAVDSHHALPIVTEDDLAADLLPFQRNAALPWLMTAHIVYTAWDARRPATLSPEVIGPILRERIGFAGVVVSDDLSMRALGGPHDERVRRALAAGCDLALHCTGVPEETRTVLRAAPPVSEATVARLAAARAQAAVAQTLDEQELADERDRLLA